MNNIVRKSFVCKSDVSLNTWNWFHYPNVSLNESVCTSEEYGVVSLGSKGKTESL